MRRFLRITAAAALLALAAARTQPRKVAPMPERWRPPPFDSAAIPPLQPVNLSLETLDDFLLWAAATPVGNANVVRQAIAASREQAGLVDGLLARLFDLPVRDLGLHLILLSVIGETGRDEFVEPLSKFIALPEDYIVARSGAASAHGDHTTYLDGGATLQSRAVEMLAWLKTREALQATLAFAAQHDAAAVRRAALDAYLYNHDESAEAMAAARTAARPDEVRLVGLARRTRGYDRAEFEASVAAFYRLYPAEQPPIAGTCGCHSDRHRTPSPRS